VDRYRELCRTYKLKTSEIVVDIFSDPKFMHGSFTSTSPKIRRETIERVKKAMDAAKEIDCPLVNPWPGQDGHDYLFQSNYRESWKRLIDGVRECAEHRPDVRIALEYKLKEPRSHILLSTVGKTLFVCSEVGLENVGATLDVGHAMMAYENLAESAVLLSSKGKLFNIHLNDNYGDWDWDLVPATTHLWQFTEFLLWLKAVGYKGWMLMDVSPNREDPVKVFTRSIRNLKLVWESLNRARIERLIQLSDKGDISEAWQALEKVF